MNVLSLFDGLSAGRIALERAGIKVGTYYASEVDKYAIQVSQKNYLDIIRLGDVRDVDVNKLDKIDMLIGGSPCQSFSFAGKRNGMTTKSEIEITSLEQYLKLKKEKFEFEGQSYLFWEFVRVWKECNPKYFFLENVRMEEKWERIISSVMGVNPVMINSSIFSAQNRVRLYWTNIGHRQALSFLDNDLENVMEIPKDKGILLRDILEKDVDEKYYLSEKLHGWLESHAEKRGTNLIATNGENKGKCLTATATAKMNLSADYICCRMTGRNPDNPKSRKAGLPTEQMIEPRLDKKSGLLTTVQKDNLIFSYKSDNPTDTDTDTDTDKHPTLRANAGGVLRGVGIREVLGCDYRKDEGFRFRENGKSGSLKARAREDESCGQLVKENRIRRLIPIECERLQTIPDGYTDGVSDSQRYKMIGNSWTVDVIAFIFSHIKDQE